MVTKVRRFCLRLEVPDRAAELALGDLARDLESALGPGAASHTEGLPLSVKVDDRGLDPEAWVMAMDGSGVSICGGDSLGAVYGIYEFSRRFVGVDPFWFWKDLNVPQRCALEVEHGVIESKRPSFRFRGWFLNDEDLLTGWCDGCLPRRLDYPFYQTVVHPEIIECVCETLLRAGGNLIIPASFVNIMEPAERALIERAVARGLYVTQHHIEPLGVSHFSAERYWAERGQPWKFSYAGNPERARQTWRAYAREWVRVAGDQVIWQLGLRGRGDRPVWHHDADVRESQAGAFISRALEDQCRIVREVDLRSAPEMTLTLWEEGSQLMATGHLQVPDDVTLIFCDRGASQTMQEDFYTCRRESGRGYGVYSHLAYWGSGPHLAQGVSFQKIERVTREVLARGDTELGIVNVANIREFVLGLGAQMALWQEGERWDAEAWLAAQIPAVLRPLYTRYFAAILEFELGEHDGVIRTRDLHARTLTDGEASQLLRVLRGIDEGSVANFPQHLLLRGCADRESMAPVLRRAACEFRRIAHQAEEELEHVPAESRAFFTANLTVQSRILAGLYAACAAMIEGDVGLAAQEIDNLLLEREKAATGRWLHWYRGDHKMNVRAIKEALEAQGGLISHQSDSFCASAKGGASRGGPKNSRERPRAL